LILKNRNDDKFTLAVGGRHERLTGSAANGLALHRLPNQTAMPACYHARSEEMTFLGETFPSYPANQVSLRIARPAPLATP
jgi:hypothetical protein